MFLHCWSWIYFYFNTPWASSALSTVFFQSINPSIHLYSAKSHLLGGWLVPLASPLATRSRDWGQAGAVQRIHQFGSTLGLAPTLLVASGLWIGACWWASGGQTSLCGNKEPTPFGPAACWERYQGQLQCFQVADPKATSVCQLQAFT